MCLKHADEKELLTEISKRIDSGALKLNITYYYGINKTQCEILSEKCKFSLSFTQEADIEKSYLLHKIYKNFAPTIKKIEFDKEMKVIDKDFESLKVRISHE